MGATNAKPFIPPSSEPRELTVSGGKVYFSADDGAHGRELWVSDGQPGHATMVMDLAQGFPSSNPAGIKPWQGEVMFSTAGTGITGRQLAITDGASANLPIRYLTAFSGHNADPFLLGASSRWMYLTLDAPGQGREVYRSDGTQKGTVLVRDLRPGEDSSAPGYEGSRRVAVVGDALYLFAYWRTEAGNGLAEPGLWKTDGTEEGTVCAGAIFEQSDWPMGFRDRLYFASSNPECGRELWVSDGTPKGTHLVKDINPGPQDSTPIELHPFGDLMLFQAHEPQHGKELWCTDGTEKGTRLLADLNPGAGHSDPYGFVDCGARVFFSASVTGRGRELWVTDGTPQGTRLVKDILPGPREGNPYQLCDVDGTLFFSAGDGVHGEELWRSDGSESGTVLVKDINPGPTNAEPYYLENLDGVLMFAASDAVHGRELWRSDGTEEGTVLSDDILPEPFVNPSSSPTHLAAVDDGVFMVVNDIEHGAELWKCTRASVGPYLVRDIYPGPASSSPDELAVAGRVVFFRAEDGTHGPELWRSDGTEGGTAMVSDIGPGQEGSGPRELTAAGDGVFFVATSPGTGAELWWGDMQDAHMITDIAPGEASSSPHELVYSDGMLFFAADDGVHGEELWTFNPSDPKAGANMIRDIVPVPFHGAAIREIVSGPGGAWFSASSGSQGRALWFSDGTLDGTRSQVNEAGESPALSVSRTEKDE